jgi:hypothetical protein
VGLFALLGCVAVAYANAKHPARKPHPTVMSVLSALLHSGEITQSAYTSDRATLTQSEHSLRRLSGTRREELGAVLVNLEAMAAAGQLTVSRLPQALLTLRTNREWWTTKPLLGPDARVSVPGSRLVWEHYPGQGIEIQWLATFGEANSYYSSHQTGAFEQVLSEAIALASARAGGISWDYMFHFDGGVPPWTSALSQGTALQALARAWSTTKDQRYLSAAQQALGIFKAAPPEGVLAPASGPASAPPSKPGAGQTSASGAAGTQPASSWYLQYSYAPSERILNGFVQSLVGLYDYTKLTRDPLGEQLFEAGDAEARAQVPNFDTGAWSKYDQSSESDLSYHDLLTEFLEHLCQRTHEGEPLATPTGAAGGQIAGDQVYCTAASHFRADLKTPPLVKPLTSTVKAGERAGVQIELSKVSTVRMTIALGTHTVWTSTITVEGGKPRLLWVVPSKPGSYTLALNATDLAGNRSSASGAITVKAKPKRAVRSHRETPDARGARALRATAAGSTAKPRWSVPISPPAPRLPAL